MSNKPNRVASIGAPYISKDNPSPLGEGFDNKPLPDGVRSFHLIDYKYDDEQQLILWKVQEVGQSKQVVYAFLADDLVAQYGVKAKNLPKEVILDFSEKVKCRTVPFKMEQYATARRADIKWQKNNDSTVELGKAHDELDYFPYYEVIRHLQKEKQRN